MGELKKGKKYTPAGKDVPQPYRYQLQPKKAKGKTNSVNA